MELLEKEYLNAKEKSSDINEHLELLYDLAKECDSVTELGTRTGVSTRAFMYANPKTFFAYDIELDDNLLKLFYIAKENGLNFNYKLADVRYIEIEETDLLFIDTLHNYNQLSGELKLHGNKSKKYIIFHDTTAFEWIGESYEGKVDEIMSALGGEFIDWLIKNKPESKKAIPGIIVLVADHQSQRTQVIEIGRAHV